LLVYVGLCIVPPILVSGTEGRVMTFINTKGMALIGPGSEWFWAALQFTALSITFFVIYRQLRIARSTHAVEQVEGYRREFDGERMARYQLAILVALRDRQEIPGAAGREVGNYFEALGSLGRKGHLDVKLLWDLLSLPTLLWWTVLEPFVQRQRIELGESMLEEFEWLVGVFTKMDRRAGRILAGNSTAYVANWLAAAATEIEALQDRIQVGQSLRSVTIAPPDDPVTSQSAAATQPPSRSPSAPADSEQAHRSD
jgi:hypothetical protein